MRDVGYERYGVWGVRGERGWGERCGTLGVWGVRGVGCVYMGEGVG